MCTVTYLPTPSGFLLTHNRDEAPARSPAAITREKTPADTLLFPRDTKAGGAWLIAAKSGKTACLLNGAFEKHRHQPPYRRSRGLMLLDFFALPHADDFFNGYDFDGIEPFTFLFFADSEAIELRWDGTQKHLKALAPAAPHFWCSATLYPAAMQARREEVFKNFWVKKFPGVFSTPNFRFSEVGLAAAALRLHQTGTVGDPENDFVMNRQNGVRTVSITQIRSAGGRFRMRYLDLLEGHRSARNMTFSL